MVAAQLPAEVLGEDGINANAIMRRISNLSSNFGIVAEAEQWELAAAAYMQQLKSLSSAMLTGLIAAIAVTGLFFSYKRIQPQLRARHQIERTVKAILVICSTIAILTTIGIVLSMVGETMKFFSFVPPAEFFFGTTWNPRFSTTGVGEGSLTGSQGSFGLLPLLSGTMMVAGVALLVAIPLGLMVAIYLAEYAPANFRATAKPIIEVLAGIPTIVYGFFALVTVGPFLTEFGAVHLLLKLGALNKVR
jgi:phosphate transport system permease protein